MWKLSVLPVCFMTIMVSAGKSIRENKQCLHRCFIREQMCLGKTIPDFSAVCREMADGCRNSCYAKKDDFEEVDEDED